MSSPATAYEWRGRELIDKDGAKLGTVAEIYVDPETDRAEWAAVTGGMFGNKSYFVPLTSASAEGEGVRLNVTQHQVKSAPSFAPETELSPEAEATLRAHYGIMLRAEQAPSFVESEPLANGTPSPAAASSEQPTAGWSAADWQGRMVIDKNGEKIGKLQEIYVDVETDEPQFGTVKEGFIGRHLTFVPLGGVNITPDHVQVPVTRDLVRAAPNIERQGGELSRAGESHLYHHYELNYTPPNTESGRRLARR